MSKRGWFHIAGMGLVLLVTGLVAAEEVKPQDVQDTIRKAAEQGLAEAQCVLGVMYDTGNGVPKDSAEAVKWYRKAAEQGFAKAQCTLGVRYANGEGVPKDSAEAVKWYRKAAEQGYAAAQFNFGVIYCTGEGVPKDDVQAYMWYNLAGQTLEDARKNRDKLGSSMTSQQIAEAQRLSREWKPGKAAEERPVTVSTGKEKKSKKQEKKTTP